MEEKVGVRVFVCVEGLEACSTEHVLEVLISIFGQSKTDLSDVYLKLPFCRRPNLGFQETEFWTGVCAWPPSEGDFEKSTECQRLLCRGI